MILFFYTGRQNHTRTIFVICITSTYSIKSRSTSLLTYNPLHDYPISIVLVIAIPNTTLCMLYLWFSKTIYPTYSQQYTVTWQLFQSAYLMSVIPKRSNECDLNDTTFQCVLVIHYAIQLAVSDNAIITTAVSISINNL